VQLAAQEVSCPYCGEPQELEVDPVGPAHESFIQDCAVCCRPWVVRVSREGDEVTVSLSREDD
jgi:hypothetical protein